jgi:hypothetical protein
LQAETCNLSYSEQNIRGLAINFLRQHYKLRPRSGTSGTRVVHKPHYYQGVTIDARLAYQKPDLEWFTATVEASSVDSAHEILYRVNFFRIAAHALIVALVVLVGTLALPQVLGESVWQTFGRPGVYFFLLQVFLVSWGLAGALLSTLPYYRYIYAIAQFIRFYANAQWVAYDAQIFSVLDGETKGQRKRRERYYRELERQCLHFGFGLMEIGDDNRVKWLIEPSHIDQFKGTRSRLPTWVAVAGKAPPLLKGLVGKLPRAKTSPAPAAAPTPIALPSVPTDGMTDPLADPFAVESYTPMHPFKLDYAATIVPAKKGRSPWYKQPARFSKHLRWRLRHGVRNLYPQEIRKRPGYYELPWWLVTTGFLLLTAFGGLAYLQSEWSAERRPGQIAAAPDLAPLEPAASPAESDAIPGILAGEYDHELTAEQFDLRNREVNLSTEPIIAETAQPVNTLHYVRYDTTNQAVESFGCGPLGAVENVAYVLAEGDYPVLSAARERAAFIAGRFKIPASIILNDCLTPGTPGYLLYVGFEQTSGADASLMLRRYARRYGLELEVFEVE